MALVGTLLSLLFSIVPFVLIIVGLWRINTKAGRPGWHAIIPFLSQYTQANIGGNTKNFVIMLIASLVGGLFAGAGVVLKMADVSSTVSTLLLLTNLPASVVAVVMYVKILNNLSKAFGKGSGFTVGMLLLPMIFFPILGLGGATYDGEIPEVAEKPKKEKKVKEPKAPKEPKPAKAPKEKKVKEPKVKKEKSPKKGKDAPIVEEPVVEATEPVEETEEEKPRVTMDQKMWQSLTSAANKPKPVVKEEPAPVKKKEPEAPKKPAKQTHFTITADPIIPEYTAETQAQFAKPDYLIPAFARPDYQPAQPPVEQTPEPVVEEPIVEAPVVEEPVVAEPIQETIPQQNPFDFKVPTEPATPTSQAVKAPPVTPPVRGTMQNFWDDERYKKLHNAIPVAPQTVEPAEPEPQVEEQIQEAVHEELTPAAPAYIETPDVSDVVEEMSVAEPQPEFGGYEFNPPVVEQPQFAPAAPAPETLFNIPTAKEPIAAQNIQDPFAASQIAEEVPAPVQQPVAAPVEETAIPEPVIQEQPVPVIEQPVPAEVTPPVVHPAAPPRFVDPKPVEEPKAEEEDEELPPPPIVTLPPKRGFFSRNKSTAIDRFHNEDGGLK